MRDEEKKNGSSPVPLPTSFYRTRAKKSLGQNFLVDERVVERIIGELGPRGDEAIIEIGPGRGELTSRLVECAGRVVAVELDRELVPLLNERFRACANFHLVEADALTTDLCALVAPFARARVVANLPYYISTAILQRLIEQRACIREMILMLQREVVERITAPPGSSERGYLSVLIEAYCEAEALFDVAPDSFRPVPKVWSTIVRLSARPSPDVGVENEALFRQLVSAAFAQKRKTIFNNLRGAPLGLRSRIERGGGAHRLLEKAQLAPGRRAETLTLKEWAGLARIIEGSAPEA
jgi:16S rRNA (adenine1518-N6/adenine1519-N6)-dimethyltransferase